MTGRRLALSLGLAAGLALGLTCLHRLIGPGRAGAIEAWGGLGGEDALAGAEAAVVLAGFEQEPPVKAADLEEIYRAYAAADQEAWQLFNGGDAEAIAAAGARRRALAYRALAALSRWADEATPPGPLEPAIEVALLARRMRQPALARKALERLAQLVPPAHRDYGLVQLTAGAVAQENGGLPSAAQAYQRAAAATDFVARDEAFLRLGEARAALGDSAGAEAAMRAVLAIDPASARLDRALAFLAAARLRAGDYAEAGGLARTLPSPMARGDRRAGQLLLAARIARAQNLPAVSRQQYRILFQEFPGLPLSGRAWDEFVEWRQRAGLEISDEDQLFGAQVLLRTGREAAGLDLLRGIAANPGSTLRVEAADREGLYYYGRRHYDEARQAWRRMAELAAGQPDRRGDAAIGIARTYRNAGDVAEMTRAYQSVMADTALPTAAARATWELAREYKSLGRFADCEAILSGYLARFPRGEDAPQALFLRGLSRFILGRNEAAGEDFRQLLRQAERRADREAAAYWLARSSLERTDTTGAVETLRAALAYDVPDGYYGYRIRTLLNRLSPGDSAISWAPAPAYDPGRDPFRTETLSPLSVRPRTHYARAIALGRGGFADEAQTELARAADLAPSEGVFQEMIAGLANRIGLYSFSMTSARRALARADSRAAEARLWRYVYALGHFDLIEPAARSNDLDPMLVAALIRQESLFDPNALSRAGAKGLMQLMLPTARRVAVARGEPLPEEEDLYRPELSVTYGTQYLKTKLGEFGENVEVALAAYNAGETKAHEWESLVTGGLSLPEERRELERRFDPDLFVELIDYAETKDYVRRVRYNQETFHLFYDGRGVAPGDSGQEEPGSGGRK